MHDEHTPPPPERRRFLKWVTHGLGALVGAVIAFPAIAYLLDPRNRPARERGFKRVGRLSDLTPGVPKQFVINDVRRDAYTLHPSDVIGRVWLVRGEGEESNEVKAFTTICPHLGCSINYQESSRVFLCPCHNGTFNLQGEKQEKTPDGGTNPAPRNMDSLEYRLVKDEASPPDRPDSFIEVRYENFKQAEHEKKPKV
jgi:Rieske Fe-S protein